MINHDNVKASVIMMATEADEEYLQVLLSVLADYSWVRDVTVLLTDYKPNGPMLSEPAPVSERDYDNVRFFGANCYGGWGSAESTRAASLAQGGFNEIRARNDLIALAEEQLVEGDYLLSLDPDEVILPETHDALIAASQQGARQIFFSTFCLLSRDSHAFIEPHGGFLANGNTLYDPHIRIFRKGFSHISNPGINFGPNDNNTVHCTLTPPLDPFDGKDTYVTESILHLHLPYVYGPKCVFRPLAIWAMDFPIPGGEGERRDAFDEGLLPQQVRDAILAQEQKRDLNNEY